MTSGLPRNGLMELIGDKPDRLKRVSMDVLNLSRFVAGPSMGVPSTLAGKLGDCVSTVSIYYSRGPAI